VRSVALARAIHFSLIELGARETTMRRPMNAQRSGQQWFQCFSPDGLITRQDAVDLIRKHAAKARIFEDLEGHPALMIATHGSRRLVLLTDLTDAQIRHELPTAWLREHQQADMFRDAARSVTNDESYGPGRRANPRRKLKDVFIALFSWR
jgi:hypothetical protein